jgi:UDP-glucose 4-epimerase
MKGILDYKKDAIYKPARTGELFKSFLNVSKAEKVLDWKPEVNFSQGLKETTAWFRKT